MLLSRCWAWFARFAAIVLLMYAQETPLSAAVVVTGFELEVYATVPDPVRMAFDPDGNLYVGRDEGPGSTRSLRIHKVGVGGALVTEYGDVPIGDPDAVLFDANGAISGVSGSVIVGSVYRISAILPDESVVTLFSGPSINNPTNLVIDGNDRFLFSTIGGKVLQSTGQFPSVLIDLDVSIWGLAVDIENRLLTGVGDGTIRIHNPNGTIADPSFVTGLPAIKAIEFAQGSGFGSDLFAGSYETGEVFRIDHLGNVSLFASGFGFLQDIQFGPDGALYVSDHTADRIYRISAVPEPSSVVVFVGMFVTGLIGLQCHRRRRRNIR